MKYRWNSFDLEKKNKTYGNMMLVMMAIVLACLFLLPEALKVVNILFLLLAALFWFLSYHAKSQDRKLKPPLKKIKQVDD